MDTYMCVYSLTHLQLSCWDYFIQGSHRNTEKIELEGTDMQVSFGLSMCPSASHCTFVSNLFLSIQIRPYGSQWTSFAKALVPYYHYDLFCTEDCYCVHFLSLSFDWQTYIFRLSSWAIFSRPVLILIALLWTLPNWSKSLQCGTKSDWVFSLRCDQDIVIWNYFSTWLLVILAGDYRNWMSPSRIESNIFQTISPISYVHL